MARQPQTPSQDPAAEEAVRTQAAEREAAAERARQDRVAREAEQAQRDAEARQAEMARRNAEQIAADQAAEAERRSDAAALAAAEARHAARSRMDLSGHRLEIRGPAGGRWRAGRHFTVVPTIIQPGVLTRAEREMIDTDPMLSVRATDADDVSGLFGDE